MALLSDIDQISDEMRVEPRLQLPEMLQAWPSLTTRLLLGPGEVIIHPEPLLSELTSGLESGLNRGPAPAACLQVLSMCKKPSLAGRGEGLSLWEIPGGC